MGAGLIPLYHPPWLHHLGKKFGELQRHDQSCLREDERGRAPVANYTHPEQNGCSGEPSREQRSPCKERARHVILRRVGPPFLGGSPLRSQRGCAELRSASCHAAESWGPGQKGDVCNGKTNVSVVLLPINCRFTFAEKFTEI